MDDSKKTWECEACGETNKHDRTHCNNCGKERTSQPSASSRDGRDKRHSSGTSYWGTKSWKQDKQDRWTPPSKVHARAQDRLKQQQKDHEAKKQAQESAQRKWEPQDSKRKMESEDMAQKGQNLKYLQKELERKRQAELREARAKAEKSKEEKAEYHARLDARKQKAEELRSQREARMAMQTVIQKIKKANETNIDAVVEELEHIKATQMDNLGASASLLCREADTAVKAAREKIEGDGWL